MTLVASPEETAQRDAVFGALVDAVQRGARVVLPAFDPSTSVPADQFALTSVGAEPNTFGGTVGPFRYQFEGEEDLLHLIVTRLDGKELTAEEGQTVALFLMPQVPPSMLWLKPGQQSQHFYLAHDLLV